MTDHSETLTETTAHLAANLTATIDLSATSIAMIDHSVRSTETTAHHVVTTATTDLLVETRVATIVHHAATMKADLHDDRMVVVAAVAFDRAVGPVVADAQAAEAALVVPAAVAVDSGPVADQVAVDSVLAVAAEDSVAHEIETN